MREGLRNTSASLTEDLDPNVIIMHFNYRTLTISKLQGFKGHEGGREKG